MSKQAKYEINEDNFYKLPRFLFNDEDFKKEKLNLKILYAVLFDDFDQMKRYHKNNPETKHFLDENNQIYITYKNQDLAELLDCSCDTITRLKTKLAEKGLLEEYRTGGNKPNRLYPKVPQNVSTRGFFKLPKIFFTEKFYRTNLNDVCKVGYSMMFARKEWSKENDFKDKEGNVCLKFAYKSFQELLNCGTDTITKMLNILMATGLLLKTEDSNSASPNYYIRKPQKKQKAEKEVTKKGNEIPENKGKPQNKNMETATQVWVETATQVWNYTTASQTTFSNTCTNDKSDMYVKSAVENQLNTHNKHIPQADFELYQQQKAEKDRYFSKYPEEISLALKPYDFEDAQTYMSIICHTKNEINQTQNTAYTLEDMDMEIARTIDSVKRKMKKNHEAPNAMCGYFKVAMIDCIEEFDIKQTLELLEKDGYSQQDLALSEQRMRERKEARMKANKYRVKKENSNIA